MTRFKIPATWTTLFTRYAKGITTIYTDCDLSWLLSFISRLCFPLTSYNRKVTFMKQDRANWNNLISFPNRLPRITTRIVGSVFCLILMPLFLPHVELGFISLYYFACCFCYYSRFYAKRLCITISISHSLTNFPIYIGIKVLVSLTRVMIFGWRLAILYCSGNIQISVIVITWCKRTSAIASYTRTLHNLFNEWLFNILDTCLSVFWFIQYLYFRGKVEIVKSYSWRSDER